MFCTVLREHLEEEALQLPVNFEKVNILSLEYFSSFSVGSYLQRKVNMYFPAMSISLSNSILYCLCFKN